MPFVSASLLNIIFFGLCAIALTRRPLGAKVEAHIVLDDMICSFCCLPSCYYNLMAKSSLWQGVLSRNLNLLYCLHLL
jgi:hypothetical protein